MTQSSEKNTSANAAPQHPIRRSEYWSSVVVLVVVAGFFVSIAALCYGIITTPAAHAGEMPTLAFPWVGWFAALLTTTACILGFAQYVAGKKTDEPTPDGDKEQAWAQQLPQKAQHAYRIIKDAPLFMVCFAFIALGATLLVIDGAFAFVSGVLHALIPYAPYFIGGLAFFATAIAAIMAWFRHANNKLMAEYAFRREVMEKTGVILLDDKGKAVLPPGGQRDAYAIGTINHIEANAGPILEAEPIQALPEGKAEEAPKNV